MLCCRAFECAWTGRSLSHAASCHSSLLKQATHHPPLHIVRTCNVQYLLCIVHRAQCLEQLSPPHLLEHHFSLWFMINCFAGPSDTDFLPADSALNFSPHFPDESTGVETDPRAVWQPAFPSALTIRTRALACRTNAFSTLPYSWFHQETSHIHYPVNELKLRIRFKLFLLYDNSFKCRN
jgi:hypothetical protein